MLQPAVGVGPAYSTSSGAMDSKKLELLCNSVPMNFTGNVQKYSTMPKAKINKFSSIM